MKRIAINGFGRIGRLFYRALLEQNFLNNTVEVVAVNDLGEINNLAYLLKYDSVHGRFPVEVKVEGDMIIAGDHSFKVLNQKVKPNELPWSEHNIDIVIESTGVFEKEADAKGHIEAGAKNVIISAPSDSDVPTFLVGVNHEKYNGEAVISNASCTTNCLAPLVHVLLKEGIGIEEGFMSTNHAYTATQELVDGPSGSDFRRGRAAGHNIVVSSTGASKAMKTVIPEIDGKIKALSFRVPVIDGSVIDLTFRSARETSLSEINSLMKKASETYMKGILGYTEDPVVSSDFIHDSRSSVYDVTGSMELNSRFFKLIAWYDNEWGYSNRLVDLLKVVAERN